MTTTYTFDVCVDCTMLIANGERPEDNPEFELLPFWSDTHVVIDCGEEAESCTEFTWSPCGGCGSRLGGSRHQAHAWPVT